jgi:hypothetical protein
MDAVFYLLDAMRLFRGKSLPEIQDITFEVGILGKYGLDINDLQRATSCRVLMDAWGSRVLSHSFNRIVTLGYHI